MPQCIVRRHTHHVVHRNLTWFSTEGQSSKMGASGSGMQVGAGPYHFELPAWYGQELTISILALFAQLQT